MRHQIRSVSTGSNFNSESLRIERFAHRYESWCSLRSSHFPTSAQLIIFHMGSELYKSCVLYRKWIVRCNHQALGGDHSCTGLRQSRVLQAAWEEDTVLVSIAMHVNVGNIRFYFLEVRIPIASLRMHVPIKRYHGSWKVLLVTDPEPPDIYPSEQ